MVGQKCLTLLIVHHKWDSNLMLTFTQSKMILWSFPFWQLTCVRFSSIVGVELAIWMKRWFDEYWQSLKGQMVTWCTNYSSSFEIRCYYIFMMRIIAGEKNPEIIKKYLTDMSHGLFNNAIVWFEIYYVSHITRITLPIYLYLVICII